MVPIKNMCISCRYLELKIKHIFCTRFQSFLSDIGNIKYIFLCVYYDKQYIAEDFLIMDGLLIKPKYSTIRRNRDSKLNNFNRDVTYISLICK